MSEEEEAAGSGIPDLGALMSRLGEMQQSLLEAQEAAAAQEVEGSAGGGTVKVRLTGDLHFEEVQIDPSVVDPQDVDMLQDLILAAVRDGIERARAATTDALTGGIDLGGLGFGGLLGGGGPSPE